MNHNINSLIFGLSLLLIYFLPVLCQGQNYPVMGKIIREDPALDKIIPKDARLQVLASGFEWTEGPVWVIDSGYLLFSDIPNNAIMKWKEGDGASIFMKPSGYTGVEDYGAEPGSNGLIFDEQGQLIMCEHGDRRLSVLTHGGGKVTLADNYQGKRFNSPNDAVLHSSGAIYFTDPPYGLPKRENDPMKELDIFGVYRLSKDGEVILLTDELIRPNGIVFSPDEKTLYVAQSDSKAIWMSFPVKADGTLDKGKIFYDASASMGKLPGAPDGMKVDKQGNIYATGPGGIYIFSPQGKLLGRIDTGQRTSNCAWGDDGTVLYITADNYLCRIKTLIGNR